ncbi:MAG TPA: hypothetical protein DDY13_09075 [Cytophagales bacterium]|nr:hypothetical protein [Cytophagales bacterium]
MITVLIPNYNKAKWIPQCLQSCLTQGSLLHEIIVVDDHSTDNSWETLQSWKIKYPEIIKVFKNPKKGANLARNFAFSKATGGYIQWLDSDDYLLPGKFENQIIPLQEGKAEIVYSDWRIDYFDEGNFLTSEHKYYKDYEDFLLELIKDNWTSPNNYLMTRKFAEKLDNGVGWNPETSVGQDREYFTMAGILGARFKYVAGIYAVYNSQNQGTVSGIDFKERLLLNQVLENRFRKEIQASVLINVNLKKVYIDTLNTHLLKAKYYNNLIEVNENIRLSGIKWNMIHVKMRPIILWIYLKTKISR